MLCAQPAVEHVHLPPAGCEALSAAVSGMTPSPEPENVEPPAGPVLDSVSDVGMDTDIPVGYDALRVKEASEGSLVCLRTRSSCRQRNPRGKAAWSELPEISFCEFQSSSLKWREVGRHIRGLDLGFQISAAPATSRPDSSGMALAWGQFHLRNVEPTPRERILEDAESHALRCTSDV